MKNPPLLSKYKYGFLEFLKILKIQHINGEKARWLPVFSLTTLKTDKVYWHSAVVKHSPNVKQINGRDGIGGYFAALFIVRLEFLWKRKSRDLEAESFRTENVASWYPTVLKSISYQHRDRQLLLNDRCFFVIVPSKS